MSFHGREAVSIENEHIRVTVLREGGHVAELLHKKNGVNPLWVPPWPSAEPSTYHPELHSAYGDNSESKLLMGIMGHNLCLDLFGPPSSEEAAAGLTVHGESSIVRYEIEQTANHLNLTASLPLSALSFQRVVTLDGEFVLFHESVFNLQPLDRPLAWTQHITLGPPFLTAKTQLTCSSIESRTFEDTSFDGGVMAAATNFKWPALPLASGGTADLSVFSDEEPFSRFTTHLMKPGEQAGFAAFSPEHQTLVGYRWSRDDFPWLGLWQESKKRSTSPWNRATVACAFEFGVSPYPETRRHMVARAPLFDTPVFRWLPALGVAHVHYRAFVKSASTFAPECWR